MVPMTAIESAICLNGFYYHSCLEMYTNNLNLAIILKGKHRIEVTFLFAFREKNYLSRAMD